MYFSGGFWGADRETKEIRGRLSAGYGESQKDNQTWKLQYSEPETQRHQSTDRLCREDMCTKDYT